MAFDLPEVQLNQLRQSPLRIALIQLRFRHLVGIEDPARVGSFLDGLSEYALVDKGLMRDVRIDAIAGATPVEAPPETAWRLEAEGGRWTVILSPTTVGFETRRYPAGFDNVVREFARVMEAVNAGFGPATQTRFGMRYVNEIEDERLQHPGGLAEILNQKLVAPLGQELGWDLEASLTEMRFRQSDGTYVLRHGLIPPGRYLLDFDYFTETTGPFEADAAVALANDYHRVIEEMFVWALRKDYLASLTAHA